MELPKATETPKPVVAAAFGSLLMAIGAAFAYFRGGSPKQAPSATDLDVALVCCVGCCILFLTDLSPQMLFCVTQVTMFVTIVRFTIGSHQQSS